MAVQKSISGIAGIVLQYPFYAGIAVPRRFGHHCRLGQLLAALGSVCVLVPVLSICRFLGGAMGYSGTDHYEAASEPVSPPIRFDGARIRNQWTIFQLF